MLDILRKTMMAGIGAGAQTRDKVEEVLQEWVEKGRMTSSEARELAERITNAGRAEYEKTKKELAEVYDDLLKKGNVVTQSQFNKIETRLHLLENQVSQLLSTLSERTTQTPPSASEDANGPE